MEEPGIKILVVDDDVPLLGVMEECLGVAPEYRIYGTNNVMHALELLQRNSFDVVISDFSLGDPKVDGLELLRRAQAIRPGVLGIIVTAYASMEISLEAIRLGVYDFLTKPFQMDELKLAVRNAASQIRLSRENSALRQQTAEMMESMVELKSSQAELMEQIRSLRDRFVHAAGISVGPASVHRLEALQQAHSYERSGETLGEQLEREERRLENLLKEGLIEEPVYRKWMETRRGIPAR